MTTIANFTTPEEAHLFRMYLAARKIPAFLLDEHVVQLFWHLSQAMGGVRLVVSDKDAPTAREAWGDYRKALGTGLLPENEVRAWPFVGLVSLLIGVPFLLFGRKGRAGGPKSGGR